MCRKEIQELAARIMLSIPPYKANGTVNQEAQGGGHKDITQRFRQEKTRAYIRLYLRVHWGTKSVHSQQNMSCTVIPGRETEASERYGRIAPHQYTTGVSDSKR